MFSKNENVNESSWKLIKKTLMLKGKWQYKQLQQENNNFLPGQRLTIQFLLSQRPLSISEEPCYPWTSQLHSETRNTSLTLATPNIHV